MGFFKDFAQGFAGSYGAAASRQQEHDNRILEIQAQATAQVNAQTAMEMLKQQMEEDQYSKQVEAAAPKTDRSRLDALSAAAGDEVGAMYQEPATVKDQYSEDLKLSSQIPSLPENIPDTGFATSAPTIAVSIEDVSPDLQAQYARQYNTIASSSIPAKDKAAEIKKLQENIIKGHNAINVADRATQGRITLEKAKSEEKRTIKPTIQNAIDNFSTQYKLPTVDANTQYINDEDFINTKKDLLKNLNSQKSQESVRSAEMVARDAKKAADAIRDKPETVGASFQAILPDDVRKMVDSNFAIVKDSQGKLTLSYKNIGGGLAGAISNYEGQKLDNIVIDFGKPPAVVAASLDSLVSTAKRLRDKQQFAAEAAEAGYPQSKILEVINEYDNKIPILLNGPGLEKNGIPIPLESPSVKEWLQKGRPDLTHLDGFSKLEKDLKPKTSDRPAAPEFIGFKQ